MLKIMEKLTNGLGRISSGTVSTFDTGPLKSINGVLDQFGLNFSGLLADFNETFQLFQQDILHGSNDLFDLRPISLPRFPNILQIGSKMPSMQYSSGLKTKLWNKLAQAFPAAMFNGVKVPVLELGETFLSRFPTTDDFPGDLPSENNAIYLHLVLIHL